MTYSKYKNNPMINICNYFSCIKRIYSTIKFTIKNTRCKIFKVLKWYKVCSTDKDSMHIVMNAWGTQAYHTKMVPRKLSQVILPKCILAVPSLNLSQDFNYGDNFSVISLIHLGRCLDSTSNQATIIFFHILSNSLLPYYSMIPVLNYCQCY